jgi:hypothetical protein
MRGGRGRRGEGYCPWFAFSFSRLGAYSVEKLCLIGPLIADSLSPGLAEVGGDDGTAARHAGRTVL